MNKEKKSNKPTAAVARVTVALAAVFGIGYGLPNLEGLVTGNASGSAEASSGCGGRVDLVDDQQAQQAVSNNEVTNGEVICTGDPESPILDNLADQALAARRVSTFVAGFRFSPTIAGKLTKLVSMLDDSVQNKCVYRLIDEKTGEMLINEAVACGKDLDVDNIALSAGHTYFVSAQTKWRAHYRRAPSLPATWGQIKVLDGAYTQSPDDLSNLKHDVTNVWGSVDIVFEPKTKCPDETLPGQSECEDGALSIGTFESLGGIKPGTIYRDTISSNKDGKYVVYRVKEPEKFPSSYCGGPTSTACSNAYLGNFVTGTHRQINVSINGVQDEADNGFNLTSAQIYRISDDGRYVAFITNADLFTDDKDYLDDQKGVILDTEENSMVYVDSGLENYGDVNQIYLSGNGVYAYYSVERWGQWFSEHIFKFSVEDGTSACVAGCNENPRASRIFPVPDPVSSNGDKFIYNMAEEPLPKNIDEHRLYYYDSTGGESKVINMSDGVADFSGLSVSGDGRYLVFSSIDLDLDMTPSNGKSRVYRYDLDFELVERVDIYPEGDESDGSSRPQSISDDGRLILFFSTSTELEDGVYLDMEDELTDEYGEYYYQIGYVRDMVTGGLTRLPTPVLSAVISGDGKMLIVRTHNDVLRAPLYTCDE